MDRWNPDITFVIGLAIVLVGSVVSVMLLVGGGRFLPGLVTYVACLLIGGWITAIALRVEMDQARILA